MRTGNTILSCSGPAAECIKMCGVNDIGEATNTMIMIEGYTRKSTIKHGVAS